MVGITPLFALASSTGHAGLALVVGKRSEAAARRSGRTRPELAEHAGCCAAGRRDQRLLLAGRPGAGARCSRRLLTRRSSCRRTGCGRCRPSTAIIRTRSTWRGFREWTTSRPRPPRGMFGGNSNWRGPVWFPLNYLVIRRWSVTSALLRRRLTGRVPDRLGPAPYVRRSRLGPAGPLDLSVCCRSRWATAVLRRGYPAAGRPRLAGQPRVQRVFPRRQRGRSRRLAPDRLDRPDRRRNQAPPWRAAQHRRGSGRHGPQHPEGPERPERRPAGQ